MDLELKNRLVVSKRCELSVGNSEPERQAFAITNLDNISFHFRLVTVFNFDSPTAYLYVLIMGHTTVLICLIPPVAFVYVFTKVSKSF